MINILLIVFLISILFLNIYVENLDILSPIILFTGSVLLMGIIYVSYNSFKNDLDPITWLVIVLGIICFEIGYLFSNKLKFSWGGRRILNTFKYDCVDIPNAKLYLTTIFMSIIVFLTYRETQQMASMIGNNFNLASMMNYARIVVVHEDYYHFKRNTALQLLKFIGLAIGSSCSYVLIYPSIKKRTLLVNLMYCFNIIMAVIIAILGSGRTYLIQFFCTIITFFIAFRTNLIFEQKKDPRTLRKAFKIIIITVSIFAGIFLWLGKMRNFQFSGTIGDLLYIYTGAAIKALDSFLKAFLENPSSIRIINNEYIGEESLYGIYSMLQHFGIEYSNLTLHLPMIDIGQGMTTNIYTVFRTFVFDFGILGSFVAQFVLGLLTGVIYSCLKQNVFNENIAWIYGFFVYGLVMTGIEACIVRDINISTALSFVGFVLYNKLFVKKLLF